MTDTFAIAVAQFAPTADESGNLAIMTALIESAVTRGAQVVVFPEYSSYFVDPFDATLVELHDTVTAAAAEHGAAAIVPDGVHPTPQGSAIIADAWLAAVVSEAPEKVGSA